MLGTARIISHMLVTLCQTQRFAEWYVLRLQDMCNCGFVVLCSLLCAVVIGCLPPGLYPWGAGQGRSERGGPFPLP